MEDFRPIGEVAKTILDDVTRKRIDQLCNRHIAMALSDFENFDDNVKDIIKSHFRYFSKDIKCQVLGLGDCENEKSNQQ